MRRKLITGILWVVTVVGLLAPPLYAYHANNPKVSINDTNVIRDTQLLLALNGFYIGPLTGQCDDQTREAIGNYTNSRPDMPVEKSADNKCNVALLNSLKKDLSLILTTGTTVSQKAVTPNANDRNDKVSDELSDIRARIKDTNAALKGITDGFATNFLNQYNGLASTGMTIFITGISVTVAIIALVSNILREFITKSVDKSHQKFLDESKDMLREAKTTVLQQAKSESDTMLQEAKAEVSYTASVAHAALATQIYARLGGRILYSQIINFYKDINCPGENYKRDRYLTYVGGGAHISTVGNDAANDLVKLYKQQNKPLPEDDNQYVVFCRNNFIFYVSSINDKYLARERDEKAIKSVRQVIAELETFASDENKNNKYWRDVKDTLVWAKLCLGTILPHQAKEEIELLARDSDIAAKSDLQERYDFYDRFPEHVDQVKLRLLPALDEASGVRRPDSQT